MRFASLVFALLVAGPVTVPLSAAPRRSVSSHTVRKGETAAQIARRSGVSLDRLAALNPRINLDRLPVKTRLKLVGKVRATPARARRHAEPLPSLPGIPASYPLSLARLDRVQPIAPEQIGNSFASNAPSPQALADHLQPVLKERPVPGDLAALGFEAVDPNNLDLLWPVETRTVSSGYGPRIRSHVRIVKVSRKSRRNRRIRVPYRGSHQGIDLNAPNGTDVFACQDGKVVFAGWNRGLGNYVVVSHGNGVETVYGHNSCNLTHEGEVVRRGQKIAEVGRTGHATGPHVHLELRLNGLRVNPAPYLNSDEEISDDLLAKNDGLKASFRR